MTPLPAPDPLAVPQILPLLLPALASLGAPPATTTAPGAPPASAWAALGLVQDQQASRSGGLDMLVMVGGMVLIVWLVAIRPERKERKRKEAMVAALKKNDRVLTTGGLYATVAAVHENELTLKFDDGPTRVRAVRSAIAVVLDGGGKEGAKDAGGDGGGSAA